MSEMIELSQTARGVLAEKIKNEILSAPGRKALEFGSGKYSLAPDLREELEYLACTDKTEAGLGSVRPAAEANDISLIPDSEMGEDCYFGRFHLVYTVFGFSGLPHLVDEIMRLRRLIIKGGKLAAVDFADDGFETECVKQLKRCGFAEIKTDHFLLDGRQAFMLSAEK